MQNSSNCKGNQNCLLVSNLSRKGITKMTRSTTGSRNKEESKSSSKRKGTKDKIRRKVKKRWRIRRMIRMPGIKYSRSKNHSNPDLWRRKVRRVIPFTMQIKWARILALWTITGQNLDNTKSHGWEMQRKKTIKRTKNKRRSLFWSSVILMGMDPTLTSFRPCRDRLLSLVPILPLMILLNLRKPKKS